ncbi:MAG TPA: T9SS type A sorting domain-containing protein, partial [Bacteroidota bacterium]|nr:T9SS type A sorting domain-containing protein [Bacteroidota bacterium]
PAKGTLTMNGGTTMYLNPAGSMNEGTNPVSGTISATRTISTSGDPMGNIGFDVASAAVAPGVTTVVRQNGTALSGNGHSSIKRYYDVTPTVDNALGATVDFAYAPSELNGITETNLILSKSTDGGTTWTGKGGSINTSLHKVTATGVQSLSRWTAADVNAPLYITHTVVERKFADVDGNPATTGDQSLKKWWMYLYVDSVTPGTLIGSGNPNSGVLLTPNLASGTYIAVEGDSTAWLHLGTHEHGTTLSNTLKVNAGRYDTVSFTDASANSVDTIDFINQSVSNMTLRKFRSLSGNPASLDARKAWGLTVYKGSVAPGNIVATGNVDSLTTGNLQAGLYIASEADSGAAWQRVNGNHGLNDTMTLVAGQAVADTFVNFKPNTITVSGFTDADGSFLTAGDRTAHAWSFVVTDTNSHFIGGGTGTTVTLNGLGDGVYIVTEADSASWIHLGNVVNAIGTQTNANNVMVTVADGQTTAVSFVNAPPVYSSKFRSFLPNLIPVDVDNKGKAGKYVVPGKPDKAQFSVLVESITDSANGLHMEFATAIDTGFHLATVPASVVSTTDSKLKKWDFAFSSTLANPESVYVTGYSWTNKALKVSSYYFRKNGTAVSKPRKDAVATSILREPMPNRINGLFEAFNYGGFNATGGLVVGVNKKAGADSSKIYGWFQSLKYSDVLKSLDDKGTFHGPNTGRPLDVFTGGKQITGQQKSLSPNKQNNSLLASMIALKLNITLSALGVTTPGFGELVYDSRSGDPLDGKMVKEIAAYIDTAMMGTVTPVTVNKKTTYTHQYDAPALYPHLDSIVASINGAFEGTVDTTRFFDSLRYAGTAELIAVPFLHADPNSIPARIIPMAPLASQNLPMAYTLYQNYPNPFNPTTTIQFDLPEASIVTLKVYNILGQEVATLLSRQQLSDGTQTVQFNAAKYASGVYFYRLNTEKLTNADDGTTSGRAFVSTKKMVLIK